MRGALFLTVVLACHWLGCFTVDDAEAQAGDEEMCALQLGGPMDPQGKYHTELMALGSQAAQIPLSIHPLSDDPLNPDPDGPSSPAMTVDVSPVTSCGKVLPPQRVLFDTGSAGLALCNKSFSPLLKDQLKPGLVPCKSYGGPGNWVSGYWGRVYKGKLEMGGVPIHGAHYAVMEQDIGMPCNIRGFMGIFGASLMPDYFLWETTSNLSEPLWPPGKVESCEESIPGVTGKTTLMPPLEQLSRELAEEQEVRRLGIYWSGLVGDSVGMIYMNHAAVANPHYVSNSAMQARLKQGLNGEYNIFIKSIKVDGVTFTGFPCTAEDLRYYCILDTGSGSTVFPQEVADAIGESGSLEIELEGPRAADPSVKLVFDISALKKVNEDPIGGAPFEINESFTMLGFPTWAFYYTVFSSDGTVDFVPHAYPELA